MKKVILLVLLTLGLNVIAYCGQLSKIELTDGSVINGEIVSYLNGVYTINTATVGEIKVGGEKVAKIESAKDNSVDSQVSAYGQKLMKNQENAVILAGLASNFGLQEMAKDPQVLSAAKAGELK